MEEDQDAYHSQCDVGTAYEPGESVPEPGEHRFIEADALAAELRLIKSEAELDLLRAAGEIGVRAFDAIMEAALRDGALDVEGTGFPWQRGSNVYIAGHRLGFSGTRSHLVFWDLPALEKGERVILRNSRGRTYEYAVFREVVSPREVRVTQPVPGESVVSLQTRPPPASPPKTTPSPAAAPDDL